MLSAPPLRGQRALRFLAMSGRLRIVVTGGPTSGKTTVVEALAARGYRTVPEAALDVIAELSARLGVDEQRSWRLGHPVPFQRLVLERQDANERAAADERGAVFLDRGRLDGLAYLRHFGATAPPDVLELATAVRYDRVVLLDTLRDAPVRSDTGRSSDRATSLALRDALLALYREHGYEPAVVPEMPVAERVEAVLAAAGLDHASR